MGESTRESTVLHRPAVEPVPERVLELMERDGWTPTQVRALIASYRELRKHQGAFSVRAIKALHSLRANCDTSSKTTTVCVAELSVVLQEIEEMARHG